MLGWRGAAAVAGGASAECLASAPIAETRLAATDRMLALTERDPEGGPTIFVYQLVPPGAGPS